MFLLVGWGLGGSPHYPKNWLVPPSWKMLGNISDCVKKIFLYFTASLIIAWISIRIIYIRWWLQDPGWPGWNSKLFFFIYYILRLQLKRFILARRDPSFALPGSCFAGTKFSHVIASGHLSEMKKLIKKDLF